MLSHTGKNFELKNEGVVYRKIWKKKKHCHPVSPKWCVYASNLCELFYLKLVILLKFVRVFDKHPLYVAFV